MPYAKRLSKAEKCFQNALIAMERDGVSRRRAASIARLPLSSFQYRLTHRHDGPIRRSALTADEEGIIVNLIKQYAAKGFPLGREDVADAVEILVSSLPLARQASLPFLNNRPGKKFLSNFQHRHKDGIAFKRSSKEEDLRWRSCNAETLTTHMASIGKLIKENNISPDCIVNIDETGKSPNKDCLRSDKRKAYHTRGSRPERRSPIFKNIEHITLLPVVFANGDCGRPLFVLKGKQLKYQVVGEDTNENVETVAICLPEGSLTVMREDVAGVDSAIFFGWAKQFAADCKRITSNGRSVLLLLDGYRSHMSYKAMHFLKEQSIIVYALPAHTSGMTQPLDVGVFGPFKEHLRNLVESVSSPDVTPVYTLFDYLKMVRHVYSKSFSRRNILSGFKKSGIYPLNWQGLIRGPWPLSYHEADSIISVADIAEMIEKKREMLRWGIGLQPIVIRGGYLDTTEGLCLTSDQALLKAKEKYNWDLAKSAEATKREAAKAEKEAKLSAKIRKIRLGFEARALKRRVELYGVPNVLPRSMKVRRQAAKRLLSERRAARFVV